MRLSVLRENFEDLFGLDKDRAKIVSVGEPQKSDYTLELYRGFDVDTGSLKRDGEYYVLSPDRSEQGLMWFTHKFISFYDPVEYVSGRGSHLLTYPLRCVRHFQEVQWNDGSSSTKIPDRVLDRTDPTSNGRFHMGIELPNGWVFSYKTEKFIGCSRELRVTSDMITKQ